MKMSKESFAKLSEAINGVLERCAPDISLRYRDQSLSHMRFRWDLFHAIPVGTRTELLDTFYKVENLNDDNIDTALKKIVPPFPKEV